MALSGMLHPYRVCILLMSQCSLLLFLRTRSDEENHHDCNVQSLQQAVFAAASLLTRYLHIPQSLFELLKALAASNEERLAPNIFWKVNLLSFRCAQSSPLPQKHFYDRPGNNCRILALQFMISVKISAHHPNLRQHMHSIVRFRQVSGSGCLYLLCSDISLLSGHLSGFCNGLYTCVASTLVKTAFSRQVYVAMKRQLPLSLLWGNQSLLFISSFVPRSKSVLRTMLAEHPLSHMFSRRVSPYLF